LLSKGMKLTKPELNGASRLIPSVESAGKVPMQIFVRDVGYEVPYPDWVAPSAKVEFTRGRQ